VTVAHPEDVGRRCEAGARPVPSGAVEESDRIEAEAAAFRTLLEHLRERADVQNVDLMELAGFCRNCLARWYAEAAAERGTAPSKEEARELVYGMPYEEWKARHQTDRPRGAVAR
jgi:uncharacterized protein